MTEPTTFTIDDARFEPAGDLDGVRSKALLVGASGALLTIAGYFLVDHDIFFRSLLVGWVYWLGIALGLFYICLMVHVSGGRWGIQMRRVHEASGRSLWLFALIAIPLFGLGMHELYDWTHASAATDPLVQAKANYLKLWFDSGDGNGLTWTEMIVPGFYPRLMLTFALWLGWAFKLTQLSERYDETGDDKYRVQQMRWSAGGLLVCVMLATFGSIDWLMSTDPHWFSSLYGPQMLDWQMLSALAFSVPLLIFFSNRRPLDRFIRRTHFHDYGKLMLALTMIWGYFSVSQFLIIWSGDLPEEVTWYLARNQGGWKPFTIALVIGCFFLPFLILLSQDIKFKPKLLMNVALFVLVMRWFDYYWQVTPNLHDGFTLHLFDPVPAIGIGGLWVWLLFTQLRTKVMVPVNDPVIQEAAADV